MRPSLSPRTPVVSASDLRGVPSVCFLSFLGAFFSKDPTELRWVVMSWYWCCTGAEFVVGSCWLGFGTFEN